MLKRLSALLKAIPRLLSSCLRGALTALRHIPLVYRGLSSLAFSCLKGIAMLLVCGILLFKLLDSLPSQGVPSTQLEKNLPKMVPSQKYDYSRSVVRLYRNGQFFCSGVVIGGNYVLTASHCLVDNDGWMNKGAITVVNDDESIRVVAKPAGINLRMDWGLLLGDFRQIPGAMVWEVGWEPQAAVLACGYPHGSKAQTCQVLVPVMNDGFLIKCAVGGMLFPGMSGGPVFDREGHVVGLNTLVYPAESKGGVAYSPVTSILANFGIAD